jgi:anti-sigma regulatory factor (Ser/Thr protein kinase)
MKRSFEFSADKAVLANIGELVVEAANKAGLKDSEINDVQLAVDEACTNTIIHGLKEDPSKTFQLEIRWETGEIEVFVHEAGEHFDLTDVPTPDVGASLEDRAIGGLGIFFIRQLMDRVEYQVGDDGAKTLYMVKRSAKLKI